jgi:hypothetical protein
MKKNIFFRNSFQNMGDIMNIKNFKWINFKTISGSLNTGKAVFELIPGKETISFLVSGRSMANRNTLVRLGDNCESYNFLGIVSGQESILLSSDLPLNDITHFKVEGKKLSIHSQSPVNLEHKKGIITGLLENYGRRNSKDKIKKPVFGWNSWDNLSSAVTYKHVIENMDEIEKRDWLKNKIEYIVVDDGWQTNWGTWIPNGKFAKGMDTLAEDIHSRGFKAGLWLAPLCVEPTAPLYKFRNDVFVKDNNNHPYLIQSSLVRSFYALDMSVQESQDFIADTFRSIRKWGYDYVKLDFLYPHADALLNTDAHTRNPFWSSNTHTRKMLEIARQELGNQTHILGCGYLYELGFSLVDEVRITNDIATHWENVYDCYCSHVSRFFMNQNMILTDPDFANVRVPGITWKDGEIPLNVTAPWERNDKEEGWRKGRIWNEEEMKMSLALIIMSGGSVILSDFLPQLNNKGWEYIKILIKYGGMEKSVPLDLNGKKSLPCIFKSDNLLAFFNPFDRDIELEIPEDLNPGREIFTSEQNTEKKIKLISHSCKVFEI